MSFQAVELKCRCPQHVPFYGCGSEVFYSSASYSWAGCALPNPEGIMHIAVSVMGAPDIMQGPLWGPDAVTWNDTCEELLYISHKQKVVLKKIQSQQSIL